MDGVPDSHEQSAPKCSSMSAIQGPSTSTGTRSSVTTKLPDHDYLAWHVSQEQPMPDHDYLSRPVTPISETNTRKRPSVVIEEEPQPAKKVKLTLSSVMKDILTDHRKMSVNEILVQLQSKYPESFR